MEVDKEEEEEEDEEDEEEELEPSSTPTVKPVITGVIPVSGQAPCGTMAIFNMHCT